MFHNCPRTGKSALGDEAIKGLRSTKIPFLLTIFMCQTHFLFPHPNFIQKSTRVPRRSHGKTLHKRRSLIYFSHAARCSSLILITVRTTNSRRSAWHLAVSLTGEEVGAASAGAQESCWNTHINKGRWTLAGNLTVNTPTWHNYKPRRAAILN